MTEMENKVNLSAYKKEMKDVLQRLVKTMPAYKELRFFVACVINHYLTDLEKDSSDIVVLPSVSVRQTSPAERTERAGRIKRIKKTREKIRMRKKIRAAAIVRKGRTGQPLSGCSPMLRINFHRKNRRTAF